MKKTFKVGLIFIAAVVLVVGLGACSTKSDSDSKSGKETVIKVGASPVPHAEILEQVKRKMADEGYKLEIVTYNDYVLPNKALDNGEIQANFTQHQPYLDNFNEENKTDLVSVAKVHFEPLGLYPGKTKQLDDVKEGAVIAVPNDPTNEARALLLLEKAGLIKLKKDAGLTATVQDIDENTKKLTIKEIEAAQISRSIEDVDLAVINGNYAAEAGFNVEKDALAMEAKDSDAAKTYVNIIAVKKGNENDPAVKALAKAVRSDDVKKFIEEKYKGAVVPVF